MSSIVVSRLAECEQVIERGLQTFIDVGNALLEIKTNHLYGEGYASFNDYCEGRWGFKLARAYQFMSAAQVVANLADSTIVEKLPESESQTRPLASLKPDEQRQVWESIVQTHGDNITAAVVKEAATKHKQIRDLVTQFPESDQAAILQASQEQLEHVRKLADLYKSSQRHNTTDTYSSVIKTGGFAYGDEMELWCAYWQTPIAEVIRALNQLARYHAIIESAEGDDMQYKDAQDRNRFNKQFSWQANHLPEVERILKKHLPDLVKIRLGTEDEDTHKATDMVITLASRSIAVRLRRARDKYRDMTIRALIPTGNPTELHKLQDGHGDLYFYGWVDGSMMVNYMIVDLNQLRKAGVFHASRRLIKNPEGTGFVVIKRSEIRRASAMIAEKSFEQW